MEELLNMHSATFLQSSMSWKGHQSGPSFLKKLLESVKQVTQVNRIAQFSDLLKPMSKLEVEQEKPYPGYPPFGIKVRNVLPEPNYGERLKETGGVQPSFKLETRAFRVFKALFYTPSDQDGPGDITWTDLLHFMFGESFSPFKLYGSLWHFDNQNLYPIQFHEPRPHSKISLRLANADGEASEACLWLT